ncbi:M1 family metallopeptidase [Kitasatospora cheerisanensis]|uniref:Aminopeptidase N n=1 Tax=Kitasatospora cheerisanensis KCTC 2395 TaxID=1348663 RepID=A0A066YLC7_9ACTN|nr:M1 family metallopeptidase [Kitasatospora cheerisanensis]KDN80699.1 putative metallopeptidase [Kitasatospora cheerisanensis KCTC 2395]
MRTRRTVTTLAIGTALGVALSVVPASAASGVGDPYFPEDGNSGYDVGHYDVRIAYDPARTDHLDGDTTVTARATRALDRFSLDLKGFTVASVAVDGVPARSFARSGAHKLDVVPARKLARGVVFTVRVTYAGAPDAEGWHTLADGGASVAGEPHSATSWYPCNDHPSDKATFALTATVPEGWTAIGNGLPGPTTTAGGTSTFRWREDRPLATYLSTVAVDRFTVHRDRLDDGTPLITAYSPDALIDPAAEAEQRDILAFLASKFGPYPFSSAGAIVVGEAKGPNAGPVALETQSRPTYGGAIFDAPVVHENAHQWFGDSVSFSDWRDGCLAECFAQYANQLWEEHKGADLDTGFYASEVAANRDDPAYWSTKLYDPGAGRELDAALYFKGSLMLHALRRTVGDEAFFATLRRWTAEHAYGNASFPQFEELAARVSGRDLTGFFDAWVRGATVPAKEYLYPGPLAALAGR